MRTKFSLKNTDLISAILDRISYFQNEGIKPTLRTIHYALYSLGKIPNTKNAYKSLSRLTVEMRKKGLIPLDVFEDGSDRKAKIFSIFNWKTEDFANYYFNNFVNKYKSFSIPIWNKQPYYIEVWLEKNAMANTFYEWLKDLEITTAAMKGYSSLTFLHENFERLKEINEYFPDKQIIIFYWGDLDPSGKNIPEYIQQTCLEYEIDIDFIISGITLKHVEKYNLPEMPTDKETIEKANRDTRKRKFIEKYGKLLLVEMDAFAAINPEAFRQEIRKPILDLLNPQIEKNRLELEKQQKEEIRQLIINKIKNFTGERE